jgi:hypothetical protein
VSDDLADQLFGSDEEPSAPAPAAPHLEPVIIIIERDHRFKKRPPDEVTGAKRIGCLICFERGDGIVGQLKRVHLGAPPSMNEGGSGFAHNEYQALKKAWMAALRTELDLSPAAQWPRPLERIVVEAEIGFSTRQARDEGNLRWLVEKALGDTLKEGGWLENDCFYPVCRYSFGALTGVHAPGRSYIRLMLFPTGRALDKSAILGSVPDTPPEG